MLEIKNITKVYPNGVKALDGISLKIGNGLFGLLGPNGAGKSTLMRVLATLQKPDVGEVLFNGVNIQQSPDYLRARLGYLPQDFGVYPNLAAIALLDHLAVLKGLTNNTARREQVSALLHQTNLYESRNKAVSTFSGGMKQRFGIAQALLGDPRLIIVDEPTAGLDPEERNRFHNLLCEIGEKVIVILSTHIVSDVIELCQQMAILLKGRIVLTGAPEEFTAALAGRIWCKTFPKEQAGDYQDLRIISKRLSGGKRKIHVLSEGCPAEGFAPTAPDLEDVYFASLAGYSLTGKEQILC